MFEALDSRLLLSVTVDASGLLITGTPAADTIHVSLRDGNAVVDHYRGTTPVELGRTFTLYELGRVRINTLGGNDAVHLDATLNLPEAIVVDAGPGHDVVMGSGGRDILLGGDGNDRLYGRGGDNMLTGGPGHDRLVGGDGDDALRGMDGNDTLYGGEGYDLLFGGAGNDRLYGQAGDDTLNGEAGRDYLLGGPGVNHLNGGAPTDNDVYADSATIASRLSLLRRLA